MVTLCIDGGRKAKFAQVIFWVLLTGEAGLTAADVGKIDMFLKIHAYVAIRKASAKLGVYSNYNKARLKAKNCKSRLLK